MTPPVDLNAHGRSWTYPELVIKSWQDLWYIWWMCVKERNWLSTEANERKRVEAGYGDWEGQHRDKIVRYQSCLVCGEFRKAGPMMSNTFHSPI